MSLSEIIQRQAALMDEVDVHVDSLHGWITISSQGEEDIFLQGDDGSTFCSEINRLWNELGNVSKGEVALYLAAPYIESLWN